MLDDGSSGNGWFDGGSCCVRLQEREVDVIGGAAISRAKTALFSARLIFACSFLMCCRRRVQKC